MLLRRKATESHIRYLCDLAERGECASALQETLVNIGDLGIVLPCGAARLQLLHVEED